MQFYTWQDYDVMVGIDGDLILLIMDKIAAKIRAGVPYDMVIVIKADNVEIDEDIDILYSIGIKIVGVYGEHFSFTRNGEIEYFYLEDDNLIKGAIM